MKQDVEDLYLPSVHNCIQSAIFQIGIGNLQRAIDFLTQAQHNLEKARHPSQQRKKR